MAPRRRLAAGPALQHAVEAAVWRALRLASRAAAAVTPRRRRSRAPRAAAVDPPAAARSRLSRAAAAVEAGARLLLSPLAKRPFFTLLGLSSVLVLWQGYAAWRAISLPTPDGRAVNVQLDVFKAALYLWISLISGRALATSRLRPLEALARALTNGLGFLKAAPLAAVAILSAYGLALLAPHFARRAFVGGAAEQAFFNAACELTSVLILAAAAFRLYGFVARRRRLPLHGPSAPWRLGAYALQIAVAKYLVVVLAFPFMQVAAHQIGARLAAETFTLLQIPVAAALFLLKPAAAFALKYPWRTSLALGARHLWVVCVLLVILNLPADVLRVLLPPLNAVALSNWPVALAVFGAVAAVQVLIFVVSEACAVHILAVGVEHERPQVPASESSSPADAK